MGLHPSSRCHWQSPRNAGIPGPHRSVLDVSHVLDGFLLHQSLRVYFTPLPRPGFALQGLSPSRSRTSSSLAVALLSFARGPCSRLPGNARSTRPPSGLCSAHQSVARHSGLDRVLLAPLLSFSSLGFFFAHRRAIFTALPTTAFHGPRRVASVRPDLLLRACLPRPRFPACNSAPTCADASKGFHGSCLDRVSFPVRVLILFAFRRFSFGRLRYSRRRQSHSPVLIHSSNRLPSQDLNLQPSAPHADALAKLRYTPGELFQRHRGWKQVRREANFLL
jgi:hypothetical protein